MGFEIWKPVAGVEGYEVSNFGRVRSLNYRRTGRCQVLKAPPDKDGYLRVNLGRGGKSGVFFVHRIVAVAFLSNPYGLPEVNHINEIKSDNSTANLEWCSRRYNINAGTLPRRLSVSRSKAVLATDPSTLEVKFRFKSLSAAEKLGFNPDTVSKACRGLRKEPYSGFYWSYADAEEEVMPQ